MSQKKTLSSDLLEEIVSRLVKNLQPEQIILFGSYAYGQPTEDSDVDLLVIVPTSNEPGHRRATQAHRALRGLGIPKDIIVLTRQEVSEKETIVTSIVSQALQKGRVLYG